MKSKAARKAKYERRMRRRKEQAEEELAEEMELRLTETPPWAREGTVYTFNATNYFVREAKLKQRYIRVSMGTPLSGSLYFHVDEQGALKRISSATFYNLAYNGPLLE